MKLLKKNKNKIILLSNYVSSFAHEKFFQSKILIQNKWDQFYEIPQKWVDDIKDIEFNELLASSIGPLALCFGWKRRHKEEFSELASGVLASSFVHGEPISSVTAIVILAHRYSNTKNLTELRNLKWGMIKGGISVGAFTLTTKVMGLSLMSFLVGVCIAYTVRKTASKLRMFEYIKYLKTLKLRFPKLKKEISRRDFLKLNIFTFKNA